MMVRSSSDGWMTVWLSKRWADDGNVVETVGRSVQGRRKDGRGSVRSLKGGAYECEVVERTGG